MLHADSFGFICPRFEDSVQDFSLQLSKTEVSEIRFFFKSMHLYSIHSICVPLDNT